MNEPFVGKLADFIKRYGSVTLTAIGPGRGLSLQEMPSEAELRAWMDGVFRGAGWR